MERSLATRVFAAGYPACSVCGIRTNVWRVMPARVASPFQSIVCPACAFYLSHPVHQNNKENEKVNT